MHVVENFLTHIPAWLVYVASGVVVGVESLGIPIPGETVLVAAALMTSHHELNVSVWAVAVAGIAGAIIGDSIGYWIGHTFGDRLLRWLSRKFPRHASAAHIAYAEHLFGKYGAFGVFFGRFIALLRIFAGPLAGVMKMHYWKFLAANAFGGVLWAGGLVYLVYTLGVAVEKWLGRGAWIALVLALVVALVSSRVLTRKFSANVDQYAREQGIERGAPYTGLHADAPDS